MLWRCWKPKITFWQYGHFKMYQTRFLTPKGKTSNFCSFHLEVPSQDIIDVSYKFPLIRHIVTTFNKRLLIDKPTEYSIFLLLWRPRCPFWSCRCTGTPDNFEGTYEQRTTIHTAVSRKVVQKKHKSVRDNAERHYGKLSVWVNENMTECYRKRQLEIHAHALLLTLR